MPITPKKFQQQLLRWFDQHGRQHLPWQKNKTPYRVWLSEIMLQQTQVQTVIPYFERFIAAFPNVSALANANEDTVLHYWTGLGYYSRARNLHRTAKIIMQDYAGHFPHAAVELEKLPGIGKSTAGAIAAIAFGQCAPILDGNVKRVFARLFAIQTPINEKSIENKLWEYAHQYTPMQRVADYTQAMMDLGATLCTRANPQCMICPFVANCKAHQQGLTTLLPKKKLTRPLPERVATLLILKKDQAIFLEKRAAKGIWGGLWSLPEISGQPLPHSIQQFCKKNFSLNIKSYAALPAFRHTFTHYHLDIYPVLIQLKKTALKTIAADTQIWYKLAMPQAIGLPKPVQSLLRDLT